MPLRLASSDGDLCCSACAWRLLSEAELELPLADAVVVRPLRSRLERHGRGTEAGDPSP
jgi:hypothetical protein